MPYRLVLHLDDRVLRLPLGEGDLCLGSAEECDVRVPHYTVSRRHALLHVAGDRVCLTDLQSSNGTTVDGARIEGQVDLETGRPLAFGSVEGMLERVAAEELESAVRVGPTSAARSVAPAGGRRSEEASTTFSLGSLKTFTVRHLPELLARALDGADERALAPAVGVALFECLPCSPVEILGPRGAVLFRGGEAPAERRWEWREARMPRGDLTVRVAFLSASQAAGYGSLVDTAARILGLAHGSGRGAGSATRRHDSRRQAVRRAPSPPDPPSVVPEVRAIYADAARVAPGDISVLVCGASGTGKEVLARFLHAASGRTAKEFVALNCAALPRDLLEAELFGVEEGAATGVAARAGKFELAHGGTLFLDEIGDMALETQAKILRALQEGEVYRIGGRSPRPAQARVISATNRDVDTLLADGVLRADLYHRIADWRVELPPLSRRRADIPNLAACFLDREVRRRNLSSVGISRAAMDVLAACDWPGNIRQLEREMARVALFLEDGELVETGHLQERLQESLQEGPRRRASEGSSPRSLKEAVEAVERREIRRALDQCAGDTQAAAELLGIGRSTLYRKMSTLGLD